MSWVVELLNPLKVHAEPWQFPPPATDQLIEQAEADLGYSIDNEYRDFLKFSNGPFIGGDGYSAFTSVSPYGPQSYSNVVRAEVRAARCFPVTTDGNGNEFSIVSLEGVLGRPVAFFESSVSQEVPAYVVASRFRTFVFFWTANQGRQMAGWPFDAAAFRKYDVDFLKSIPASYRPWSKR